MIRKWWDAVIAWNRRRRSSKPLGPRGEEAAARHLKRLGYQVVARGVRMGSAEIDLVAVDGRTVVFVEVKTRESTEAGHPSEAVDVAKQRHLLRAAMTFLKSRGLMDCPARFDVVAVTWPPDQRRPKIEHIPNAFEAPGPWEYSS